MEESELVLALAILTGYLEPADDATAADLHEARVRLARHLLANGIPALPPLEEPLPEELMDELRRIADEVAQAIGTPAPGDMPVVIRRADDNLAQDLRFNGREVSRAFGPFADRAGRRFSFEVFERAEFARGVRGPGGAPFLLARFGSASGPATEFSIARGSVWVRATVIGGPAVAWIGLRVASGTLRLDRAGTLSGDVLTLPIDAEGRLELALDAPPGPAPGAIGEDGRRVRAGRPDSVAIDIRRMGAGRVAIGPTSLEVYGARLEFDATNAICETDRDAAPSAYVVPLPVGADELAATDVRSTVLSVAGRARVERAAWALPITVPDNLRELGAAADIGDIAVVTGGGLELGWPGLPRAGYRAERVVARAGTGMLSVRASRAPGRELAQRFHLWPGSTGGRSHVELRYERPALLHHVSGVRGGAPRELTLVFGAGEAAVSPPVYADSESVAFAGRDVSVAFARGRDARLVSMRGGNDTGLDERVTLALANGLVGMTRPFELALSGSLVDAGEGDAGQRALALAAATVVMRAGVHGILPTLPDPYAASFDLPDFRRTERKGTVTIRVDWRPPASPAVRLSLGPVQGHAAQQLLPPGRDGEADRALEGLHRVYDDLPLGPRLAPLVLLDVSSNADQLGVATAFPRRATDRPPPLVIDGIELCAPAHSLQVLTVPTVQWETVWNEPNPLAAPFPAILPSTGDGGPALVRADSVRLVPIAPRPLSNEVVDGHVERADVFGALFSLPFGIRAATRVGPPEISAGDRVLLRWIEPRFGDLSGAHQLSIQSGPDGSLPGAALQTSNGVDDLGVARNVLEPTIDDFFNNRFGPMAPTAAVPVSRIDVSGYGASAISRWTNPNAAVVDVTRVQFDVLVGRTAHEVVQVQALLWPSQAVVVRSVTMHRRGSGRVMRRDSGWQAATPGLFRHPLSQCEFHTGVVQGYYGIREIRDTSQRVVVRDPVTQAVAELVAVYFDCEVAVEGAVRGHRETVVDGQPRRLVTSQRQLGFVQVWPDGAPPPGPLTPGQLAALFAQQGAIGGAIDCEIDIAGSGQRMRLAGVRANVAPAPTGPPQFAVEAGGSLRLPSAGQWSAVRVRRPPTPVDSPEVEALDSHRGLPLVRLNGMGASYRFADPRDLMSSGTPEMEYGILFASPAHRLLFRQPRIEPDVRAVTSLVAPLLADSYGMAASRGLFPRYHDAIPLPSSNYALDVVGEGELRLRPSPLEFAYTGVREISNSASMRLFVEYDATPFRLTFDSTAPNGKWSYDCGHPAVVSEDGKLGRVASALTLQEGREETGLMSMEPELKLGVSLDSASKLITVLRKLGFPVRVRVHQTHDDLLIEVKVSTEKDVKAPHGSPPNFKKRIDLGIGKYSGEIKLEIRCGAREGKSGLKLEVKGELQQETPIPKVYVGGFIEVKLKFERDHRKKESESEIALAAGVVGSVGGALIPELLEAEVTARRGYIFQVQPDAPEPANRVNLGLIMGLEIRAVVKAPVLGDVVRIEFEWEGRALIQRLEFNGVLESEVWIRAIVKAAVSVAVLFLDGEFELETEYQEHVPMVAVAGLAAAIGLGLVPPP